MDGTGRWAEGRGRDRGAGHSSGINPVRMVIEESVRHGIDALTLFAFSSENWSRPAAEVAGLMDLFCESLDAELPSLQANGVRLRFIGALGVLGAPLRERIQRASSATAGNRALRLTEALSNGVRQY